MTELVLREMYREYLLGFFKISFDDFIDSEVLNFEEFVARINKEG